MSANEQKRPAPLPVEATFNQIVLSYGGELVSELVGPDPQLPNADHYFRKEGIIAELKTFEKDVFDEAGIEWFLEKLRTWVTEGKIAQGDLLPIIYGQQQMPLACWRELLSKAERTIDRAIHKAEKQLRTTREFLDRPDARCLVFLANDGNYFLQPLQFYALINGLMIRKYQDGVIDGFVYLTINQTATLPGRAAEYHYWIPGYRRKDRKLKAFVERFGAYFGATLPASSGLPYVEHIESGDMETALELLGALRSVEKKKAFPDRK